MGNIGAIPNSPQECFLRSTVRELGFGGQAGGSKSFSLILDPLSQIHKDKFHAIMFRRTYKQLAGDDGLIELSHEVYSNIGGHYHKGEHLWTFEGFPGTIRFSHMQHEQDIRNHRGHQYAWIGFDELQDFTERQYLFLFSRNRCPNPDVNVYVRTTFNPGGIGHYWIKRRFIDTQISYAKKWFRRVQGKDIEVGAEDKYAVPRMFIPSRLEDNPYLYVGGDGAYEVGLHQLEQVDFRRLRYGDWDIRPDGRVYHKFSDDNIISYDKLQMLLHTEKMVYYHGNDFGSVNRAFLGVARDPNGNYYVYHAEVFPEGTTEERANRIHNLFAGKKVKGGWGGAPGETQQRKDYGAHGVSIKLPRVTDVDSQINMVNELFKDGKLFISSELVDVIDQLDNCVRDETGNIINKSTWHYLDGLRYFGAGVSRNRLGLGFA
jgi:hypothetical protein